MTSNSYKQKQDNREVYKEQFLFLSAICLFILLPQQKFNLKSHSIPTQPILDLSHKLQFIFSASVSYKL